MVNNINGKTEIEDHLERVFGIAGIKFLEREYYEDIMRIGDAYNANYKGIKSSDIYSLDIQKASEAMISSYLGINCDFDMSEDQRMVIEEREENRRGSFGFHVPLVKRRTLPFKGFRVIWNIFPIHQEFIFNSLGEFNKLLPIKENIKKIYEQNLYYEQINIEWISELGSYNGNTELLESIPNIDTILTSLNVKKNVFGIFEVEIDYDFREFMEKHMIYGDTVFESYFIEAFQSFANPMTKKVAVKIYELYKEFVQKNNGISSAKLISEGICTLLYTY